MVRQARGTFFSTLAFRGAWFTIRIMFDKYKSFSRLGKVFVWFSLVLALAIAVVYANYVHEAFNTSPVQCANDSMMSDVCDHPYGSSIGWTVIVIVMTGWPLLLAWGAIGIVLMRRRGQKGNPPNRSKSEPLNPKDIK